MSVRQRHFILDSCCFPAVIFFSIYNNTPHSVLFHFFEKILNSGFKKFYYSEEFAKLRIIPEIMKSIQKFPEKSSGNKSPTHEVRKVS